MGTMSIEDGTIAVILGHIKNLQNIQKVYSLNTGRIAEIDELCKTACIENMRAIACTYKYLPSEAKEHLVERDIWRRLELCEHYNDANLGLDGLMGLIKVVCSTSRASTDYLLKENGVKLVVERVWQTY